MLRRTRKCGFALLPFDTLRANGMALALRSSLRHGYQKDMPTEQSKARLNPANFYVAVQQISDYAAPQQTTTFRG